MYVMADLRVKVPELPEAADPFSAPAVLPDKLCGMLADSLNMIPQGQAQENRRKTSVPGEREH